MGTLRPDGDPGPAGPPPLLVLFGPTAVGKSQILFTLLDSRFEVISADSMQVYRHMDIGTAKPPTELRARLPHHLIDVMEPSEQFSVGQFVNAAESLVQGIRSRGRIPVLCGGTAFYISSFLFGLPEAPRSDPAMRLALRARQAEEGQEGLYHRLRELDPDGAARIQPNDRARTLRALEVVQTSGRSLFSYRWPRSPRSDHRFLLLGLERPRAELYARIDERVDRMFSDGLVDEVKRLLAMGFSAGDPGLRGIGYREILAMRSGCQTFRDVRQSIAQSSRRYAKRQITFFRSVPGVRWVPAEDREGIARKIGSWLGVDMPLAAAAGTAAP